MNPVLSAGLAALTLCLAASCAASSDTDDASPTAAERSLVTADGSAASGSIAL